MPLDYSKWDHIEDSEDEENTPKLCQLQHQTQVEKMEKQERDQKSHQSSHQQNKIETAEKQLAALKHSDDKEAIVNRNIRLEQLHEKKKMLNERATDLEKKQCIINYAATKYQTKNGAMTEEEKGERQKSLGAGNTDPVELPKSLPKKMVLGENQRNKDYISNKQTGNDVCWNMNSETQIEYCTIPGYSVAFADTENLVCRTMVHLNQKNEKDPDIVEHLQYGISKKGSNIEGFQDLMILAGQIETEKKKELDAILEKIDPRNFIKEIKQCDPTSFFEEIKRYVRMLFTDVDYKVGRQLLALVVTLVAFGYRLALRFLTKFPTSYISKAVKLIVELLIELMLKIFRKESNSANFLSLLLSGSSAVLASSGT